MIMTATACLTAAIFFEARDQSTFAQQMVAQVIMNRVEHPDFPSDVCSVVFEPKQFSFTHDGLSDDPSKYTTYHDTLAAERAAQMAQMFIQGGDLGSSSTHYHTEAVRPSWAKAYEVDGRAGAHIFYTCSRELRNC